MSLAVDSPVVHSPVRIRDVGSLHLDNEIQIRNAGTILHSGRVVEIMPLLGVFWILDSILGTRKLIDVSEDSVWVLPQAL